MRLLIIIVLFIVLLLLSNCILRFSALKSGEFDFELCFVGSDVVDFGAVFCQVFVDDDGCVGRNLNYLNYLENQINNLTTKLQSTN